MSVQVSGSRGGYAPAVKISSTLVGGLGSLVLTRKPSISGSAMTGSLLTADAGVWEQGVVLSFQWLLDGSPISGAIGMTYQVNASAVSHQVAIRVTASKSGFRALVRQSDAVKLVSAIMTTSRPTLSGTFKTKQLIKANSLAWVSGARITYQWFIDGKSVSGATNATYKLLASYKGHFVSVKVFQYLSGYSTASATSASSKIS